MHSFEKESGRTGGRNEREAAVGGKTAFREYARLV